MDAEEINRWFSDNIYSPGNQIDALSVDELLRLDAAIREIEAELKMFEQRTLTTPTDRVVGGLGHSPLPVSCCPATNCSEIGKMQWTQSGARQNSSILCGCRNS